MMPAGRCVPGDASSGGEEDRLELSCGLHALQIAAFGAGAFSIEQRLSNSSGAFAKVALAR
jgi:hypothetical protein